MTYTTLTTPTGANVRITEVFTGEHLTGFEITTSTGYRAYLTACPCDRIPCVKPYEHTGWDRGQHSNTHCHATYAFHTEHVQELAREVAATYGSAKRKDNAWKGLLGHIPGGKRVHNVSVREWAAGEWAQTMERCVTPVETSAIVDV